MSSTLKLLILPLLVVLLSHHVDSGSIVKSLPGFDGPLPFELETGYIGIGEDENVQFFYYFIKSERNPKEDPLVIWFNGGPGCSAFCGLITVNGPVALKGDAYNGSAPTLVSTTHSWSKIANVLYLDQPVGSGFSYSKTPLDITSDTDEVKRSHEFIQKWLSQHPNFYSNPLYVTGDSYSGMIIPALVQEISKGNYICCKPLINLQGYLLGNPITHKEIEQNFRIPYSYGMALMSDELYELMKRVCKGKYIDVDPLNSECLKLCENFHKCIDNLSIHQILTPNCDETSPDCFYYPFSLMEKWANDESVRKALRIKKGSTPEWLRCNRTIPYNYDIVSSVPYHKNNSIDGYPSLIFSGDHDITLPFLATQAWIRSLNYSIIDEWRPWMIKDQVAGYTRTYANKMTFATLKGSGHTAMQRSNEAFVMFQRWISGQPL